MTISLNPPRDRLVRNLLAVYIGSFFASIGFAFATPLLPLFTLELLFGDTAAVGFWVGLAIGISPALTALTGPVWGTLGDRFGQKAMIQRALVAIGLSIGLCAFVNAPWQLVAIRALIGVFGGISVACLAAVTASSTKQLLGRNIGLLQAAQTMGQVAGPLTGGALAIALGMRETFAASAVLFAIGLGLVTWLYKDVPPTFKRGGEARRDEPQPRLASSFLFWATLGVLFTANFVDGSFFVMLPLDLPRLGAPSESLAFLAGLGLSLGALAMAVAAAVAGRLSSRFHTGTLIVPMLGAAALVLLLLVLAQSWWQLIGLRALLGLVAGGLPTLAYAASANLVAQSRRGAVVGMASSAGLIGWAAAPPLVGFLISIDPRLVFAMDLLLVLIAGTSLLLAGGAPAWRSGLSQARSLPATRAELALSRKS